MELNDIVKLDKRTKLYTNLNNAVPTMDWFECVLMDKPYLRGDDTVQLYVKKGSNNSWSIRVKESNKQYIRLLEQEWDDCENISRI